MSDTLFLICGNHNHIPHIKRLINSLRVNYEQDIAIGNIFYDEQLEKWCTQNNLNCYQQDIQYQSYINTSMCRIHHNNVFFPQLLLQISLCNKVYNSTDYKYVIFLHGDMVITFDNLVQQIKYKLTQKTSNVRVLSTFPYNNYKLIQNVNKQNLLSITSDLALNVGFRLNQIVSCWNRDFLNELFQHFKDLQEIYNQLMYNTSLCSDISPFNFNRSINDMFGYKIDFIDIHLINQNNGVRQNSINHLTFYTTKIGF